MYDFTVEMVPLLTSAPSHPSLPPSPSDPPLHPHPGSPPPGPSLATPTHTLVQGVICPRHVGIERRSVGHRARRTKGAEGRIERPSGWILCSTQQTVTAGQSKKRTLRMRLTPCRKPVPHFFCQATRWCSPSLSDLCTACKLPFCVEASARGI